LIFPTDTIFDPTASAAVLEFQERAAGKGIFPNNISFFSIVQDFVAYQMGGDSIPDNPVVQEMVMQFTIFHFSAMNVAEYRLQDQLMASWLPMPCGMWRLRFWLMQWGWLLDFQL